VTGDPLSVTGFEFGKLGPGSLELKTLIGTWLAEARGDHPRTADRVEQKRIFAPREKNPDTVAGRDIAPSGASQKRAILRVPRSDDDADPAFDESSMILAELEQWGLLISIGADDIVLASAAIHRLQRLPENGYIPN